MTSASKLFTPRSKLPEGLIAARGRYPRSSHPGTPARRLGSCRCTRASRSTCTTHTRWGKARRTASGSSCEMSTVQAELDSAAWATPQTRVPRHRTVYGSAHALGVGYAACCAWQQRSDARLAGLIRGSSAGRLRLTHAGLCRADESLGVISTGSTPNVPYPRLVRDSARRTRQRNLVRRLNAIGADFPEPADRAARRTRGTARRATRSRRTRGGPLRPGSRPT